MDSVWLVIGLCYSLAFPTAIYVAGDPMPQPVMALCAPLNIPEP